jgi:hypothetical protein
MVTNHLHYFRAGFLLCHQSSVNGEAAYLPNDWRLSSGGDRDDLTNFYTALVSLQPESK